MTNNKGMHWICKWVSAIIYFIRFELIRCKLPTTFKTQLIIFYVYSKNRNAFFAAFNACFPYVNKKNYIV